MRSKAESERVEGLELEVLNLPRRPSHALASQKPQSSVGGQARTGLGKPRFSYPGNPRPGLGLGLGVA